MHIITGYISSQKPMNYMYHYLKKEPIEVFVLKDKDDVYTQMSTINLIRYLF